MCAMKHPDRNAWLCFDDVATRAMEVVDPFQMRVLKLPHTFPVPHSREFYFASRSRTLRTTLQCLHQPVEGGFTIPMHSCAPWEERGWWEITQLSITFSTSASSALFSHYTSFICD